MIVSRVILFFVVLLIYACVTQKKENNMMETVFQQHSCCKKIDFVKQVQPVLEKNCSPCHFTGGKMYEKLPFDKDTTFLNHNEAILKRIKEENENAVLKAFVLQNRTNASHMD